MNIYPSFTLIFVVFNLLGWWFKGEPFFNWWWVILVWVLQIIMSSILLYNELNIIIHN